MTTLEFTVYGSNVDECYDRARDIVRSAGVANSYTWERFELEAIQNIAGGVLTWSARVVVAYPHDTPFKEDE